MQGTRTIWTIIKDDHVRINPAKFGQNPLISLGRTSNDHSSSPWVFGSNELTSVYYLKPWAGLLTVGYSLN